MLSTKNPPSGKAIPEGGCWPVCGCCVVKVNLRNTAQKKGNGKVRKNRCFLSKTAVYLVDDTGLEPVTSRTSSGRRYYFALKSLDLQDQTIFGII